MNKSQGKKRAPRAEQDAPFYTRFTRNKQRAPRTAPDEPDAPRPARDQPRPPGTPRDGQRSPVTPRGKQHAPAAPPDKQQRAPLPPRPDARPPREKPRGPRPSHDEQPAPLSPREKRWARFTPQEPAARPVPQKPPAARRPRSAAPDTTRARIVAPEKAAVRDAVVSAKGAARIYDGHLWIYRSDVLEPPNAPSGAVVRVVDQRGRPLALAHYGQESEITLRLLAPAETEINREFWRTRLRAAAAWRTRVVEDSDAYRLVHGEGDLLPGLVIDRYADCFVLQTLTRGMDALKSMWVELLAEEFAPRLIVERNDAQVRKLEKMPLLTGLLRGRAADAGELTVIENGLRFAVDPLEGQKTGAFLDQRENRAAARRYARGRALDCFSFHGSFALHLAEACEQVTALDISAPAIERAARNAELNGITNIEFIEANVFDRLRDYDDAGTRFDTIVLDPPAFAKNRDAVEGALRGYKEINLRALRLLESGGTLITCSCSYHVDEALFLEMLHEAIHDAGRYVQLVEKRTQARDHPILLTVPESYYLKCIVLRVID